MSNVQPIKDASNNTKKSTIKRKPETPESWVKSYWKTDASMCNECKHCGDRTVYTCWLLCFEADYSMCPAWQEFVVHEAEKYINAFNQIADILETPEVDISAIYQIVHSVVGK